MLKIAINGICGKMGKRVLALAKKDSEVEVVAGLERDGHPDLGIGLEGVKVFSGFTSIPSCDIIIDFTFAEAVNNLVAGAKKIAKPLVIGTTGLTDEQKDLIKEAANSIPIVYSPNMSVGVNVLFKALELTASVLQQYQVRVKEAHHIHKKDAPSGTAKKLIEIINKFGVKLNNQNVEVLREGEIIGDHQVTFESNVDSFKIAHHAKTRDIFAQGAITAAKWLKGKPAGLYSMEDVLFEGKLS